MHSSTGRWIGFIIISGFVISSQSFAQEQIGSITGNVEDAKTNAPLAGVNVVITQISIGTMTDSLGNFSLSLRPGKYLVRFSLVGYEAVSLEVTIAAEGKTPSLVVMLKATPYVTNEVIISAENYQTSPSLHVIPEKDFEDIPNLFSDVLRSVTILPGVTSNNELTSAYNVRGQNFDANLIYLNGFEVFRPYLVQQGIEENQSVINENMLSDFEFYNGAFPVQFGDKMASVLVVNYKDVQSDGLGGEVNADLLNLGVTLHDKIGSLSWIGGFRYAFPSSFTNVLQTKGSYLPRYTDLQLLGSYVLPDNIKMDLLFITASNSFDLTPANWTGNFAVGAWDNFSQIALQFTGADDYRYDTNLLGLRVAMPLDPRSTLSASLAYYSDREFYNENLSYNVFYSPDGYNPSDSASYLETGHEYADNSLLVDRLELKADFDSDHGDHDTKAGVELVSSLMDNNLDESTYNQPSTIVPYLAQFQQRFSFNWISAYVGETEYLNSEFSTSLGLRALKYYFNGEFLVSPRASISFEPDSSNSLNFGWGYYCQPPYFYETRDKSPEVARSLLSQRAIHYVLKYENKFGNNGSVLAEAFYENLSRLIPYYTNQLELTYGDSNNYVGYTYGFDLQYQAELTEGLDTWIGYDYLNAQNRRADGSTPYQRSLLDQTHTVRIFLQDAMPGLHNSQVHVRLLFGSGYLYHPMVNASNTQPADSYQMVPDYNDVDQYPFYFRVDMGLTYKFAFDKNRVVTLTAEVLNVFDKRNILSYSWYYVTPEFQQPIQVPNLLSTRYFDLGLRVEL